MLYTCIPTLRLVYMYTCSYSLQTTLQLAAFRTLLGLDTQSNTAVVAVLNEYAPEDQALVDAGLLISFVHNIDIRRARRLLQYADVEGTTASVVVISRSSNALKRGVAL